LGDATREMLKTDDVALLKFGVNWLKNLLFKQTDPHAQAAGGTNEPDRS
jgi:hypothetical protein